MGENHSPVKKMNPQVKRFIEDSKNHWMISFRLSCCQPFFGDIAKKVQVGFVTFVVFLLESLQDGMI